MTTTIQPEGEQEIEGKMSLTLQPLGNMMTTIQPEGEQEIKDKMSPTLQPLGRMTALIQPEEEQEIGDKMKTRGQRCHLEAKKAVVSQLGGRTKISYQPGKDEKVL